MLLVEVIVHLVLHLPTILQQNMKPLIIKELNLFFSKFLQELQIPLQLRSFHHPIFEEYIFLW